MKDRIGLLTRCVILMAIIVSTGIAAATGMQLNKQLGEDHLPDPINWVNFNLYDSRDAVVPLVSQTYFPGEWQLTGEASSRMISVVLTQTDDLPEQGELWLELESEGLVVGERELVDAAPLGVTFGLGNILNMSGNQIIDLGEPTIGTDAATMQYVQDQVATITGDNLGDHTASQNLDMGTTNRIVNLAAPVDASDAATRQFVLDQVGTNGGDNLGNHTATTDIDMGSTHQVINLPAPSAGTDAANMQYVLDQVAAVPGDNLGNHTATENIQLDGNWLSGDGDNQGLFVDSIGRVGIRTSTPELSLHSTYSYGILFTGSPIGTPPPISENLEQFIWYPERAAFRAGKTYGTGVWEDGVALQGTVSTSTGSPDVVGVGTLFLTELEPGLGIRIGTYTYIIQNILSDTELTLSYNAQNTLSGVTPEIANLGFASIAVGRDTLASGSYSAVFGYESRAVGSSSLAAGTGSQALGGASVALGAFTEAVGQSSVAMGSGTTASGDWSTVFGSGTEASGKYSVAHGRQTVASGDYSSAFGYGTKARAEASTVIGEYNVVDPLSSNSQERIFIIGNGSSSVPSDAMVVERGGSVGIGISDPAFDLDVAGTINASTAIKINGIDVLTNFSETDPQVDTLTANKLCTADGAGTAIDCTTTLSTVETDPTVLASVKDGVSWSELTGIPHGFDDDVDDEGVTSVASGTGLTGGPITDTGTLSVAVPLVLSGATTNSDAVIEGTSTGSGGHGVEGHGLLGYGVAGYGYAGGGLFENTAATSDAKLAYYDEGIQASGDSKGGHFSDSNSSGYADIGIGDYGIQAYGNAAGGFFQDLNSNSEAYLGYGSTAVQGVASATGSVANFGGTFEAHGDFGIGVTGSGRFAGAFFEDSSSGTYGRVGYGSNSFEGTGAKSFIQNHPENTEQVIVYAALEGDEVATYTRGSAQLVNGEARIPLGDTFKWVTNPDIGLTAHLTPQGAGTVLFVASKTTEELVVRSMEGFPDNVTFDYIVHGLRIGFEETSVVREKVREAYIPSMKDHRVRYTEQAELRQYNALKRFGRMRTAMGKVAAPDMSASKALRDAVVEFDPAIHKTESLPRINNAQ